MTAPPLKVALLAAAAGAVIGSLARFGLTDRMPVGDGFPWTVFAINVVGSALLAGLPALAVIRRTSWLGVFLGTGVMGGFTTMSAASVQTVTLLDRNHPGTAVAYLGGTLLAALVAVRVVDHWVSVERRAEAEAAEVDL